MDKIVFVDGKPFVKMRNKKFPVAADIVLNEQLFSNKTVESFEASHISGEDVVVKLKIEGVEYAGKLITSPPNELKEKSYEEKPLRVELLEGTFIIERRGNRTIYRFRHKIRGDFEISWRRIPPEFESFHEHEVTAELSGEDILSIRHEEVGIYTDVYAQAPYNFVEFNKTIISTLSTVGSQAVDKFSGFVDLELKNLTPLFIRGERENFFTSGKGTILPGSSIRGLCRSLVEIVSFSDLKELTNDDQLFFRAVFEKGTLGNFYRGIFINIDESRYPPFWKYKVGCGWLKKQEDKYFLHSSVQDASGRQFYKVSGTFRNQAKEFEVGDRNPTGNWVNKGPRLPIFDYCRVYFDNIPANIRKEKNKGFASLEYNEIISKLENAQNPAGTLWKAYVLTTGHIDRKHYQWVVNPPEDNSEPVGEAIVIYRQDKNRAEETDLLKLVDMDPNKHFPCFYLEDNGKILEIGHTGLFRIAYKYNIQAAIKQVSIKVSTASINFPNAIFGTTENSGKLFFEDAYLQSQPEQDIINKLSVLKTLGGPKTTTFQHYLKQPNSYKTPLTQLHHWSTPDSVVRGAKLYWHKPHLECRTNPIDKTAYEKWEVDIFEIKKEDFFMFLKEVKQVQQPEQVINNYQSNFTLRTNDNEQEKMVIENLRERDPNFVELIIQFFNLSNQKVNNYTISKPQNVIARPIVNQLTFTSRIRFENLSKEELGALLFALDLPKGCYHKLGMGKPLGLGSVQITPTLTIIDRQKRYSQLFEGESWFQPTITNKTINDFKKDFEDYMLEEIPANEKNNAATLWNVPRLKQLKTMLTFKHHVDDNKWMKETEYMQLGEFKDRKVLPQPDEVVNILKNKTS